MAFSTLLSTSRCFSTSLPNFVNVIVSGSSGSIGQPLSLLLKSSPLVSKLVLCDPQHTPGVVADLSHVATKAEVVGVTDPSELVEPLQEAQIIVIAAGQPRKPGMSRADLFKANSGIIKSVMEPYAKAKSEAIIAVVTNPINSLIPYAAEILKKSNSYCAKRLFGITTLDLVRASAFVAKAKKLCPTSVKVPVVGGHSASTIVPLLSQTEPHVRYTMQELCSMTNKIREAGTKVVEAKKGQGSASISMAFAAARFTLALCRAIKGEKDVVECAFVESCVTEAKYFATPVKLGKEGLEENMGLGEISCIEENLIKEIMADLNADIKLGVDAAACG